MGFAAVAPLLAVHADPTELAPVGQPKHQTEHVTWNRMSYVDQWLLACSSQRVAMQTGYRCESNARCIECHVRLHHAPKLQRDPLQARPR